MRRKVLQDIANTLCQMMVGWRMGDDFELIAELPDGKLVLDLIEQTTTHDSGTSPSLWITGELAAWFQDRLKVLNIPAEKIISVTVEASFRTDRIKTNKKKIVSFDFDVRSRIETDEKTYDGHIVENHSYHQRLVSASGGAST